MTIPDEARTWRAFACVAWDGEKFVMAEDDVYMIENRDDGWAVEGRLAVVSGFPSPDGALQVYFDMTRGEA